jgi:hypothetical protein
MGAGIERKAAGGAIRAFQLAAPVVALPCKAMRGVLTRCAASAIRSCSELATAFTAGPCVRSKMKVYFGFFSRL